MVVDEFNKEDIIKTYRLLKHKDETEIRIINPNKKNVQSSFIKNYNEFLKKCIINNGKYNIYVGINERKTRGTFDKDVKTVRTFCIDIDPERPVGTSSTEEQLKESKEVANKIREWFMDKNFELPSMAMSGNGYQIWICLKEIKLNNEKERKELTEKLKEFEKQIRQKYQTKKINIDSIYNLSRIIKVIGTKSIKGDKHRISKWESYNPTIDIKITDHILTLKPTTTINEHSINTTKKDQSRSAKEYREILKLISQKLTKEDIFKKMEIFAKWSSSPQQYKEITYTKAYNYLHQKKIENKPGIKTYPQITLIEIIDSIKEYLYIEDTKLLELILAIHISRMQLEEKLWLIIIGPSGDGKTELVKLLNNYGTTTKVIKSFTPKTLVNGYRNKAKFPDLAPKLQDKLLLIPEMASILKLHPNEKAQVWAQLRDLYDGVAGKQSGSGVDIIYEDLNVSLIGCSTPVIDNQVLIHQDLGTREVLYRTDTNNARALMTKIIENNNDGQKQNKFKQTKELVQEFIEQKEYKNKPIKEEFLNKIQNLALTLTKLRASAEIDFFTGELTNLMYPEKPTRILGQLMVLFKSLKSLDEAYTDDRAMEILNHIFKSSCSEIRLRVLKYFIHQYGSPPVGQKKVAENIKIGNKTAYRELNILTHLGFLEKFETTPNDMEPYKTVKKWCLSVNDCTCVIAHMFDIQLVVDEEEVH